MDDHFEIDRHHPSHQQRLAKEKQVNVYFLPGKGRDGSPRYAYVVSSALLHDEFMKAINSGVIPDFAVVAEQGSGLPPPEEIKKKMLEYYGFEHQKG